MKGRLWERDPSAPTYRSAKKTAVGRRTKRRVRSKSTVNMRDKRFSLRGKRTFDGPCAERKFSPGKILDAVWLRGNFWRGQLSNNVSLSFSFSIPTIFDVLTFNKSAHNLPSQFRILFIFPKIDHRWLKFCNFKTRSIILLEWTFVVWLHWKGRDVSFFFRCVCVIDG